MQNLEPMQSRKKFLLWTATILGSVTIFKFFSWKKEHAEPKTVKMLTQDGKLVEVDSKLLAQHSGNKISNTELQQWIKK